VDGVGAKGLGEDSESSKQAMAVGCQVKSGAGFLSKFGPFEELEIKKSMWLVEISLYRSHQPARGELTVTSCPCCRRPMAAVRPPIPM